MVSRADRAKQFLPFSALSPLSQALREKEREIEEKLEISDERILEISNMLQLIDRNTNINITYYCNKQYLKLRGQVKKIDYIHKYVIVDETKIHFENILNIYIL